MSEQAKGRNAKALAVVAAAVIAGIGAVYFTLGARDNGAVASRPQPGAAGEAKGPSTGDMAAFVRKASPEAPAAISFKSKDGQDIGLDHWKGRVVLLNLWATWCAPCRKEMPALDRLQKALGSKDFEVVALAVDRAGQDAVAKFLDQVDAHNLSLYVDPTARSGVALKAVGLPTTLLIDRQGREVGRLIGPAEWDGADARRLITAQIN